MRTNEKIRTLGLAGLAVLLSACGGSAEADDPAEGGFGCREDLSEIAFRASGVEPFWGLQVRSGSIVYTTPEIPRTGFEAAEPAVLAGGWIYESVSSGPESLSLSLRLTPERCSDSMVGAIYSWSAEVDIGGEVRRGCAWEGALAPGR